MADEIKTPNEIPDNWSKPFWRSTLSGDTGAGSTSRVAALLSVTAAWLVVLYLVIRTNKIPTDLLALGIFTAMVITTMYSPAKIVEIFKNYFTKK